MTVKGTSSNKNPCDHCDFISTYKSSLKTHKMSIHEGIKYYCGQCDYKTSDKSTLLNQYIWVLDIHVTNVTTKQLEIVIYRLT